MTFRESIPPSGPNTVLIKPHSNSLDPDLYLDPHQIAQTHKYQSPLFDKSRENVDESGKKRSCPLIRIHS